MGRHMNATHMFDSGRVALGWISGSLADRKQHLHDKLERVEHREERRARHGHHAGARGPIDPTAQAWAAERFASAMRPPPTRVPQGHGQHTPDTNRGNWEHVDAHGSTFTHDGAPMTERQKFMYMNRHPGTYTEGGRTTVVQTNREFNRDHPNTSQKPAHKGHPTKAGRTTVGWIE